MKKVIVVPIAALATLLFFAISAGTVWAEGPVNTSQATAVYFDNNPHYIAANSTLWYRFDYAGRSLIVSKMFSAANTGLGYRLWAPDQPDKPFGSGTAKNVSCGDDKCQDTDLTWKGATPVAGAYYVEVVNNSSKPLVFYLLIVGEGVSFGPLVTTAPTDTLQIPSNMSPANAVPLQNNQLQTIPGNTGLWYRFEYGGDPSPIAITLANGIQPGLASRVHSADQVKQVNAINEFLGEGSSAAADCAAGECPVSDINWQGTLLGGTYYIQVYNANPTPMTFRPMIEGIGITSGQP